MSISNFSLNTNQQLAVDKNSGPVMILAGAGSGKTRTLVAKVEHLIQKLQIPPYKILCLTFSNKAAFEMKERIRIQNPLAAHAMITTFHSFCAIILRREHQYVGLGSNFTIYDKGDAKSLVKKILDTRGVSKIINVDSIVYAIDEFKNNGFYLERADLKEKYQKDEYYSYFEDYEFNLAMSNATDFGGLITTVLKLFQEHPEVALKYQEKYSYILVDEYQDTNKAQFDLMKILAHKCEHLCVVGDEDQSIYSWRGANIKNILDFQMNYPSSEVIKLEQNYRSTKNIIDAASFVIKNNHERMGKSMWTENNEGESIDLYELEKDIDEASHLATSIKNLNDQSVPYKDIAVFYRNNAQSRVLEEALNKERIQYKIIGGMEFYQRKEIKDIISYLKLLINPKDNVALLRVINTPARGIGAISFRKLEQWALDENISLWEVLIKINNQERPPIGHESKLSQKVKENIQQFIELIKTGISQIEDNMSPSSIYQYIFKHSGMENLYSVNKDPEVMNRLDNLKEFSSAIKSYETQSHAQLPRLQDFIETITMDKNSAQVEGSDSSNYVSLMTIHGSKGLEFPYVFLIGVEENIFPSFMSAQKDNKAMEEERRLFYVAMTRAMKHLSLSYAQMRLQYGKTIYNPPSRFIKEIPEKYFTFHKVQPRNNFRTSDTTNTGMNKPNPGLNYLKKFPVGDIISHDLYGQGMIVQSQGFGDNEKVTIDFVSHMRKSFFVKHAKLKKISSTDFYQDSI